MLLNNLWLDRGKCTETIAVLQIGIWPNVCIYVGNPNLGLTDTAVCEKQNWNRDKKFHQKFTCQFYGSVLGPQQYSLVICYYILSICYNQLSIVITYNYFVITNKK